MGTQRESGSFRDPNGWVYRRDGVIYRQIQPSYSENYELLNSSGLYNKLVAERLLVPHTEQSAELALTEGAYKVVIPEPIKFISYPYEWSFSQLRDAALATLTIQQHAIEAGMSLKDASAYNIQFSGAQPILIDTLSFEKYEEGHPWIAYGQFCRHFLAPLALMSLVDIRLSQLLRIHLDGVPLDLAAHLLPRKTLLKPGLLSHIHLHGSAQTKYADRQVHHESTAYGVSRNALLGLIDSLMGTVKSLSWRPVGTEWGEYYGNTNYSSAAMDAKHEIVRQMLEEIDPAPRMVWDLGANTGVFSRIAASKSYTVSWDIDPAAVEKNYIDARDSGEKRILPLLVDIANSSPAIGWGLNERKSLFDRGPVDAAMALALIHHLAIGNNVPLPDVASVLARVGRNLIIEFVPKSDSQVQRLLTSRPDIFPDYTQAGFEKAFSQYFEIVAQRPVPESERTIYLMRATHA